MIDFESMYITNEYGEVEYIEDVEKRIRKVMKEVQNEKGFTGKLDRLNCANSACIITYDNEDVGFIYATPEDRYSKGSFIDMVIKKEYRNLGIGGEILLSFCNGLKDWGIYLIGEVESDNIASNIICEKVGVKLIDGIHNYYLFPKENYKKFMENENIDSFIKAMGKNAKSSRELINEIMNQDKPKVKEYK